MVVRFLALTAAAFALAACSSRTSVGLGGDTPTFSASDAEGNTVTSADYQGRILVMDFWATWCAPCKASSPQVQALHEQFADDPDVEILAIHVDDSGDPVRYFEAHGYTYRLIPRGQSVRRAYSVNSFPTFLVIGPDGRVVHRRTGLLTPTAREQIADAVRDARAG